MTTAPGAPRIADSECARLEAAFEAFRSLLDAEIDETDLGAVLAAVTEHACRLLSVDRCAVYLLDEETDTYRGHSLRVRDRFDDRIKSLKAGVQADGFTREILATRAPVVLADARTDRRAIRSTMVKWDVWSVLGAPMLRRGGTIGCLFFDEQGRRRAFSADDVRVAGAFAGLSASVVENARTTTKLRTTLAAVARQNAALRRAAIAEHRLAELALDGADLDEIATSVAQLTSKPCAIYDAAGRRIGSGTPPGSTREPALLEPEDCTRPEISSALAGVRPGTTSVIGPFRTAGFAHRLLISPVAIRGDEWGRLVIMEHRSPLSALDAQVARRAATIIALELSARRRATELHAHSAETLVRDLITGLGAEGELARRAAFHGLRLNEPQVLCLVREDAEEPWQGTAADVVAEAIVERRAAFVARVPEGLAVVLGAGDGTQSIAHTRDLLEEVLGSRVETAGCIAAVSTTFSGVAGFARAYHEVRQATRCLKTFGANRGCRVLTADELGAGSLFLASTSRAEADQFVRHTLGPLLEGGERPMRDLLSTLALFFASSRSVRETADHLGVHENTIRYRLARIAELTGLEIATNADHQLAGQLATLVLRLEGALPEQRDRALAVA